jgi:ribonuclease Z
MVHVGDSGRTDNLLEVCHQADLLVIEATYLHAEREMARDFAHLTARQAAELAQDAEIKNLILTHISRRYRERDVLDEARAIFPQIEVARDFDVYRVKRGDFWKQERK